MSDYGDLIQSSFGQSNPALPQVVGNVDEDPERAQRAMDLAQATGAPSTAIFGDLDEFERQHKAAMASEIVRGNPHLSDFVQSNPMVPKVANDDYGNLDNVSQKITTMGWLGKTAKNSFTALLKPPEGSDLSGTVSTEDLANHPFLSAMYLGIATPINMVLQGMQGDIDAITKGTEKVGTAIVGEQFGREMAGLVESEAMGLTGRHGGMPEVGAEASRAQASGSLFSAADREKLQRVQPYVENGREPPTTVLPEYDKFLADQNATQLDQLKEVTDTAQQSVLRDRNPELFKQFIDQHTPAGIDVLGEVVAKLYGDKLPTPDDGLLGWVPGIEDKLALARATGDDVHIPLSDWLTNIDPKVMDELHDDIRTQPNGITAREVEIGRETDKAKRELHEQGQEGKEEPAAYASSEPLPELVPQTRAAGALEPLFSVGDRKLSLDRLQQRNPNFGRDPRMMAEDDGLAWRDLAPHERQRYESAVANRYNSKFSPDEGFHDFSINDEKGNLVGTINLSEAKGGKQLYVEMINGIGGLGPRDFGPSLMRDLLRQLKAEFPNAESITGHRVSGAREKAGSYMAKSASPVVKLDNPNIEDLNRVLEGGHWEQFSKNVNAYIKPFAERSAEDRNLINAIGEELDRIVPNKLRTQEASWITAQGVEGQGSDLVHPTGTYITYKDAYPILLYCLDGDNALGTARHEAIHHLRGYGFFKPEEWSILEKAVGDNRWIDQFRIDDRYPGASAVLKREEAIADAYKEWAGNRDFEVSPEVHTLFERMKQFFEAVKERIGKLLGKEPTWEDIFQKVDTGEIGGREGTEPLDARAFNEKLSTQPERILGPAAKFGGKVYRGITHPMAAEEALKTVGKTIDDIETEPTLHAEGFVTDKGRYLNREEAYALGRETGQIGDTADKYMHGRKALDTTDLEMAKVYEKEALQSKLSVAEPPEGGSRVFERAAALGMTTDQFKAYDKLIQARHAEDIQAATRRATEEQAREQTKQWKEDRKALRVEVASDIKQRPDVAADLFFGSGELYGKKVPLGSVKLDASTLTDAQKARLPRNYYGEHGLHPDDVANLFGYGSGDAMLERLVQYNQAKLTAGGMSAKDFVSRVTDVETDRQMKMKYGALEDNIVDAVKEQVSGETQQDILHEETMALGMRAGQAPLDKGTVVQQLRDAFAKMPLGSISSDSYLRAAGKAGRQAELSLLQNDPANAFKAKQQQYYATVIANEAAKLEKEIGRFDKLAKRFSKREIATVDQEYTNFIHDILLRVGRPVRRSIQDLEGEIQAGEYKSLQDFVEGKNGFYLREVAVADQLFDPGFRKKFEDLTVDEFRGVDMSVKSLLANGRDEKKITKAGVAEDLAVIRKQMIAQLKEFQEKNFADAKGGRAMGLLGPKLATALRTYGIDHLQMETIFNRWDAGDPNGVFQQYVLRDLVDASNSESAKRKAYAARLLELDDKADLKKSVENTLFKAPGTQQTLPITRANLRAILLNAGNDSNLLKMAKGYDIRTEQLTAWLHQHATKADWNWAQKMGDIFADLKKEADVMYRNLSGVAAESIPLKPIDTPHGQYPGWYYPLIAHPEFEGASKRMMGKDALEQEGFIRATTANGYTKSRTGAVYPLALDLDMLPYRLGQMIHDVEMRPAVLNASKIFYDKDVRQAIGNHFGHEWRDMMVPYLVDVANAANYTTKAQKRMASWSEFFRQNLITTLVGLNPGTFLKHTPTAFVQSVREVGADRFLQAARGLWTVNERTGESNWQFAQSTSQELQRRHSHFMETLGGAADTLVPQKGFATLRQTVNYYASMPVAMGDLASAVPTWLAQYAKSIEEGATHGDAAYMADRSVRRAHGSTAITNRSAVMRGGSYSPWLASVYGFFNHIMNRQYEMIWKSGEALDMAKEGQYSAAMKAGVGVTASLFAYVIAPAIIEEVLAPQQSAQGDSWGKKAAKSLTFTLGASWVGIRDLTNAMLNGRDPVLGLTGTAFKTLTDVTRDFAKDKPLSPAHAGKTIRDATMIAGSLTGMVPAQVGRVAQFGHGVATGQERPKGPWGWLTGARYGTLKGHPATFQEWQHHHLGGH